MNTALAIPETDISDLLGAPMPDLDPVNQSAQLHLPTLAAVAAFTSKDETRFYLKGVCVEIDATGVTYVATDGHRLAARRIDRPASEGVNTLIGVWIIPTEECKAFKIKRGYPDNAELTRHGDLLELSHVDQARRFRPVDGTFPAWRRLVPVKAEGALKISINGDYLASVQAFSKALGLGFVTPHWNNGEACAFSFGDDANAFCLVMPIRVWKPGDEGYRPWSRPAWSALP